MVATRYDRACCLFSCSCEIAMHCDRLTTLRCRATQVQFTAVRIAKIGKLPYAAWRAEFQCLCGGPLTKGCWSHKTQNHFTIQAEITNFPLYTEVSKCREKGNELNRHILEPTLQQQQKNRGRGGKDATRGLMHFKFPLPSWRQNAWN